MLETRQLIEDSNFLLETLKNIHPRPFLNIPQKAFEDSLEIISNSPRQVSTFGLELSQLLSRLKDSHTQVCFNQMILGNECYPIRFKSFANGIFVIKANLENKKFLGLQLKKINNYAVEEIKSLVQTIIPNENKTSIDYYLPNLLFEPAILNYFKIIETQEAEYTFEDASGLPYILVTKPMDLNIQLTHVRNKIKVFDETLHQINPYWIKYLQTEDIYYFQYNSCEEAKNLRIKKIVEDIELRKRKKIVIDLRNNKGGDSDVLKPFIEYTSNLEKKPRLFVLVSSQTFSSALINTIQLSKIENTLIIGDIPHGSPTHFGEIAHFTLPNSKLEFQSSTKLFDYPPYKLGETLNLNVNIRETFEDYISGIDKSMKYVENVLP